MVSKKLAGIVLAAGKGTRMGGEYPKVLSQLSEKPLIDYVLETLRKINPEKIVVVVGFQKEAVIEHCAAGDVDFQEQKKLLGTADAVKSAMRGLEGFDGDVLVLCGDVPLIPKETLENVVKYHREKHLEATVLTVELEDPASYGRIVRNRDNLLEKIVEAADASEEILKIPEINSGIYVFKMQALRENITKIGMENAQGEFYLTDIIELLNRKGKKVGAYLYHGEPNFLFGVNRPSDLANLEKFLRKRERNEN